VPPAEPLPLPPLPTLKLRLAPPVLATVSLTLLANLSEHRVSARQSERGDTLTNMSTCVGVRAGGRGGGGGCAVVSD
jgi:hypothetical protein